MVEEFLSHLLSCEGHRQKWHRFRQVDLHWLVRQIRDQQDLTQKFGPGDLFEEISQ